MSENITIIKRSGEKEELNIEKMHKVVAFACEGVSGVSSSQIEMNANLQFYDGMSSREIQEILVRSANDLISLEPGTCDLLVRCPAHEDPVLFRHPFTGVWLYMVFRRTVFLSRSRRPLH